ncbi:MAG: hypothetical protein AMS24_02925 [Chlamydiae bacterium SM23_39]|nr:MAG: hypothetical protein AMS24_02925 [Chlamydiae bacterium SM23_39]
MKKIAFWVILIHIVILSFLYKKRLYRNKKDFFVREIKVVEEIPLKRELVLKKRKHSKKIVKNNNRKKIISNLEKIKKIGIGKGEIFKKKELTIPFLKIKKDKEEMLINYLKSNLKLPEQGEVKVEIFISSKGNIEKVNVLSSKSLTNEVYLKEKLLNFYFPWLLEKKNLIITFINER